MFWLIVGFIVLCVIMGPSGTGFGEGGDLGGPEPYPFLSWKQATLFFENPDRDCKTGKPVILRVRAHLDDNNDVQAVWYIEGSSICPPCIENFARFALPKEEYDCVISWVKSRRRVYLERFDDVYPRPFRVSAESVVAAMNKVAESYKEREENIKRLLQKQKEEDLKNIVDV